MRSMTGFGQATGDNGRHRVTVTLKGVNHRYLDVKLRLPDECRESEAEVQELLAAELHRGRVEGSVDVESRLEREADVAIRHGVVTAAQRAFRALADEGLIAGELTAGDLLRLPEAVSVRLARERWDDEDRKLLVEVTGQALAQLVAAREREGGSLEAILRQRLTSLEGVVATLDGLAGEARDDIARGLEERLNRFLEGKGIHPDPARLAQEVAILADRSDVREELDRLGSHLAHLEEVFAHSGAVGKRLDFLLQEVFRELNTLGAKCRHALMTRSVLDAKGLAEQMREQVQNVE